MAERTLTQEERLAHLISDDAAPTRPTVPGRLSLSCMSSTSSPMNSAHIVTSAAGRMNLPIANAKRSDIIAFVVADLFAEF